MPTPGPSLENRRKAVHGLPPLANPDIIPLVPDVTPATPRSPKRAA